jgi:nucleotide-binding universal stress UspA family protein
LGTFILEPPPASSGWQAEEAIMATMNPVAVTFEHILIPIDFTDVSEHALEYAKTFAKHGNAELLLAHVEPPINTITPPEAAWIDESEIQAMREEQLDQRGATLVSEGYRARTISAVGPLYDELLSMIRKNDVDLIVLGTHGRKGLGRLMLGSDAEAMLRCERCPVLSVGPAVPELHKNMWSIREIVCATTFDPKSAEVAAFAYKLAAQYGAELIFFHITHPTEHKAVNWVAFEEAFLQYAPAGADKSSLRTSLAHIATAGSIADFAKQRNADLIVMGAAPAISIVTHLSPGTVAQVLMEAPCPVMTLLRH